MAIREYRCSNCDYYIQMDVAMSEPASFTLECPCDPCGCVTSFDQVFSPVHITGGLLTKRYTGQAAAVQGWGTYNLDYGKAGSDLASGRAREQVEERNGRAMSAPLPPEK